MNIWMLIVIGVLTMVISTIFRNARNQAPPFPRPKGRLDADMSFDEVESGSAVPTARRMQPPPLPRARRAQTDEPIPVPRATPPPPPASKGQDKPVAFLTESRPGSRTAGQFAAIFKNKNSLRTAMQLRESWPRLYANDASNRDSVD